MTKPRPPSTATRFTVVGRVKSFRHAFAGLWLMLRTQHNAWVHLSATVVVLATGLALKVRPADWRWLMDREDTPWYPTLRLFRQPRTGDWEDVFLRIADKVARFRS